MTIEIALLISVVSVAFSIFSAITNFSRNRKTEQKKEATEMTTVIVKLENISKGIAEIKIDNTNIKNEVKELRERIIIIEQASKQAHKRLDDLIGSEKYKDDCK